MENVQAAVEGNILTITLDLSRELGPRAERWQETAVRFRKQWEESEWYLGEAKASARHLEEQLRALRAAYGQLDERHRHLAAELQEAYRQRTEANWYLGESRTAQEDLLHQIQRLTAQLVHAQADVEEMRRLVGDRQQRLDVERTHRESIEAELAAVRTHGERRRALRTYHPDMTVEVHGPDGNILFHGLPRDVSCTGIGFASERPISDAPDFLQVRLHLASEERPIDATGLLTWQQPDGALPRYLGGCELLDMPADGRQSFERFLASAA